MPRALMAEARALVAAEPPGKHLLTVLDVDRMTVNTDVLQAFRELAAHNAPWVLASAVCNASQLGRVMARANGVMTNRTFVMFDSRAAARFKIVPLTARAARSRAAACNFPKERRRAGCASR